MTEQAVTAERNYTQGTGRRKNARAMVRIHPGKGRILVNGRPMEEYFVRRPFLLNQVWAPIQACGVEGRFDIMVKVLGGGVVGQAGAAQMGIARALLALDPQLKKTLRTIGSLTRDSRMKERKKYGQKRARKRFQYTKR